MRERAERLGGTLEIASALGRGTTVTAAVPADETTVAAASDGYG
jgi:nitrate/nitrite-specific signal transduction histidine kinase